MILELKGDLHLRGDLTLAHGTRLLISLRSCGALRGPSDLVFLVHFIAACALGFSLFDSIVLIFHYLGRRRLTRELAGASSTLDAADYDILSASLFEHPPGLRLLQAGAECCREVNQPVFVRVGGVGREGADPVELLLDQTPLILGLPLHYQFLHDDFLLKLRDMNEAIRPGFGSSRRLILVLFGAVW